MAAPPSKKFTNGLTNPRLLECPNCLHGAHQSCVNYVLRKAGRTEHCTCTSKEHKS